MLWSAPFFKPGITSCLWWCSASWCPCWCPGTSGGSPWPWATSSQDSCDTLWSSTPPGWSTAPRTCGGTGLMTRPSTLGRTRWLLWLPSVRKPSCQLHTCTHCMAFYWNGSVWNIDGSRADQVNHRGGGTGALPRSGLSLASVMQQLVNPPDGCCFCPLVVAVLAQKFRGGGQSRCLFSHFVLHCISHFFRTISRRAIWLAQILHLKVWIPV